LHSLMDFDFAFGYFQLLFWTFLGISVGTSVHGLRAPASPVTVNTRLTQAQKRILAQAAWSARAGKVASLLAGAFAILAAVSLTGLQFAQQQAALPMNQQNPNTEYQLAQTEATFAPYNATAQMDLAQYNFSTAGSSDQPSLYTQALQEATAAASMSPWNANVQAQAALMAYRLGNDSLALTWAARSYRDARFNQADFRNLLGISMWASAGKVKTDPGVATAGLQQVLTLYQQYHQSEHDINDHLFPDSVALTEDASMQVYVATADYLLKDYAASLKVMNPF